MEFSNEILSDTIDLKVIESKSQLISNYDFIVPPSLPVAYSNPRKTMSQAKLISDSLRVAATLFVKRQFIDYRNLDLNRLSDYGYKIFDYKTKIENTVHPDSIWTLVDSSNDRDR